MSHEDRFAEFLAAVESGDDEHTEQCALTLTAANEPALIGLLASSNSDLRWWTLRALAVCGAAQAPSAVASQLSDADNAVRAVALLALAHLYQQNPAEVALLLDQAADCLKDDDGLVRQTAADSLAMCGDDAVPALARVLFQQNHEGARTRAAGALRKIATMKAAGVLYALLNDPNHMVRMYAYEGLDEMGLLETVLVTLA